MFSDFIASLTGKEEPEEENEENDANGAEEKEPSRFRFVDVASSLLSSVRDDVDDIVSSLVTTDWKSELVTFGKAVQDETSEAIRSIEGLPEKASHVLPGMASVRQRVGNGIQQLAVGTKELFDQSVGTIEAEMGVHHTSRGTKSAANRSPVNLKFSRFEAEMAAMQRNSSTYCDEPEDKEDFQKWKETFSVDEKEEDIQELISQNAFMAELYKRIVPVVVENDVFWTRYFYRLQKLKEKHDQRQQLAQRTLRMHEEEESHLAWDDDPSPSTAKEEEKPMDAKSEGHAIRDDNDDEPRDRPSSEKESSDWSIVDVVPKDNSKQASSKRVGGSADEIDRDDSDEDIDEDWGDWD